MADKTPLKANFTGTDVTSLGEFAAGDTVPVASGGTGATTAADARTNLGAAALAGSASQSFSMLNGAVAGTLSLTGASSTLGYGTGAGGTVTQATSKSTAVTLNKPSGQITMNAEALAAGASAYFLLANTSITNTDAIAHNLVSGLGVNNYRVETVYVIPGQVKFRVTNISGGSLSDALIIQFIVLKGATS